MKNCLGIGGRMPDQRQDDPAGTVATTGRECALCGWMSEAYLVLPVPLASPPQENVVCRDCGQAITAGFAAQSAGRRGD